MKVLCCLVNWRTADMTLQAVGALVRELRAAKTFSARVVVVDNDSRDGSLEKLRAGVAEQGWSDVVDVVDSGYNGGFGYGNNVAFRMGLRSAERYDAFYLLNSDAFMDEGALASLVEYLGAQPRVGIVGSRVRGVDGGARRSCFRFPSVWDELDRAAKLGALSRALAGKIVRMPMPPATTTAVDWVAGASMLIRREVLEQIGLFDERYFLYYEETDLCLRARRAGWDIAYVKESSVAHVGGASTGITSEARVEKRMPRYLFESRRHYFVKNHGRPTYWAANVAYAVAGASFRVRRVLQGKPDPERPREWLDWTLFNFTHP